MLRICNLRLDRGRRSLLRDVDLELGRGEVGLMCGANGSGKTSLIRCIAGMNTNFDGRITVDGCPPVRARASIAYVPSGELVWSQLRAAGQLDFVLRSTKLTDPWPPAEHLAMTVRREFGGESGFWLSSGQRRLLTLASVLSIPAELVLLDEPLNFLSPEWAALTLAAIEQCARLGAAVFVCSHTAFELATVTTKRWVLADGTVKHAETVG